MSITLSKPWAALDVIERAEAIEEARRLGAGVARRSLDALCRPDRESILCTFDYHYDAPEGEHDPRSLAVAEAADVEFARLVAAHRQAQQAPQRVAMRRR